jgi:hypothetical protein
MVCNYLNMSDMDRDRILFIRISDGYGSGYGIAIIRRIQIIRYFLRIIRPSQLG